MLCPTKESCKPESPDAIDCKREKLNIIQHVLPDTKEGKNKKKKKRRKINTFIKDLSWHELLPSWMASEVLIRQRAADI